MIPQPNTSNSIFKWKNPNMGTAATMATNMIGTLGKSMAPDVYDPRIGMAKPNTVGTMTDFSLAGVGSTFGLPGLAIGAGADVLKNLYAVQQQDKQYNEAVNKADFYDGRDSRLQMMQPDYTQMMRYGGVMQYGMGGQVPAAPAMPNAKMEANELVLIPQQDGSYTEYMQTSPNAPSHEQGGVNAQLPAGAIVFPAEYVQQVKAALAAGDFTAISQIAQQMLQAGEQAKQQGQAFTSGAGGELPQAQQQQAQQMPQEQMPPQEQGMFPPMMRAGGIAKMLMYGGGGVVPDMMQSDSYATQKARMEEEEKQRLSMVGEGKFVPVDSPTVTKLDDAGSTVSYENGDEIMKQNAERRNADSQKELMQRDKSNMFPSAFQKGTDRDMESAGNLLEMSTTTRDKSPAYSKASQSELKKYDKNGNYINYENNLDYYSQENKSKRNAEYKRQGKTNPDANDSQTTTEKNPEQIKPKPKAKSSATTETTTSPNRQDRTTSRQQAMKAGIYEGSRWNEKTSQRMVKVNGKEEVFDPNKKYEKTEKKEVSVSATVNTATKSPTTETTPPAKIQPSPKAGKNIVLAPTKNPMAEKTVNKNTPIVNVTSATNQSKVKNKDFYGNEMTAEEVTYRNRLFSQGHKIREDIEPLRRKNGVILPAAEVRDSNGKITIINDGRKGGAFYNKDGSLTAAGKEFGLKWGKEEVGEGLEERVSPITEKKEVTLTPEERADMGRRVRQTMEAKARMESQVSKMNDKEIMTRSNRMNDIVVGFIKSDNVSSADYLVLDDYYNTVLGKTGQVQPKELQEVAKKYYDDFNKIIKKLNR
jgi:hypothetical protein